MKPTFEEKQEAHRRFCAMHKKLEAQEMLARIQGLGNAFKRFAAEVKNLEAALAEVNIIFGEVMKGRK